MTHREDLLREAVAFLPEEERADILSLLDAGEWAEAAHQMRGVPGDRVLPEEALALIEAATAIGDNPEGLDRWDPMDDPEFAGHVQAYADRRRRDG